MHNWAEGVLQTHFRYRWKFWAIPVYEAKKKRSVATTSTSGVANKRTKLNIIDQMDLDEEDMSEDSDSNHDIPLNAGVDGAFFSMNDIETFRRGMKEVVLPPGLPHLPPNLGESKHGKLKASQWHALFSYIVPLVILEMYVESVNNLDLGSNRGLFLMNTAHLVHCTNILYAHKFKSKSATLWQSYYMKYSDTCMKLFPNVKIKPNHHYALHLPDQMIAWGPLIGVAEFGGERLIGDLQRIKTNDRIGQYGLI